MLQGLGLESAILGAYRSCPFDPFTEANLYCFARADVNDRPDFAVALKVDQALKPTIRCDAFIRLTLIVQAQKMTELSFAGSGELSSRRKKALGGYE